MLALLGASYRKSAMADLRTRARRAVQPSRVAQERDASE